jgi:hypothetical protein
MRSWSGILARRSPAQERVAEQPARAVLPSLSGEPIDLLVGNQRSLWVGIGAVPGRLAGKWPAAALSCKRSAPPVSRR